MRIKCPKCGEDFESYSALNSHTKWMHPTPKKGSTKRKGIRTPESIRKKEEEIN